MTELNDLIMCAWCKRIKINGNWIKESSPNYEFITASYGNNISHGICKEDAKKYFGIDVSADHLNSNYRFCPD